MIDLWCLSVYAEDVIELEALSLHGILVSSSKFFLSYECVNVHLLAISHLAYGNLHRVQSIGQVLVE